MNVLVVGGTRFLGPPTVRRLVAMGHRVTLFNRGRTKADLPPGVERIVGDRDRLPEHGAALRALRPDVVLDMVAGSERHGRDLVDVLRGAAGRIVVVSSADVYLPYGRIWRTEPGAPIHDALDEDGPLRTALYPHRGTTAPEIAKHRAAFEEYDKILVERAVTAEPALPATVVRLAAVYGPGDPQHRLFPLVKRMDDGRPAILLDARRAGWRWSRADVENCALALALAVADDRAAGRTYNVAFEPALTEAELTRRVGEAAGWHGDVVALPPEQLPPHLVGPNDYASDLVMDTGRIRRELGYAEEVTLAESLRRAVAWQRANPPTEIDAADFDYAAEDRALAAARA